MSKVIRSVKNVTKGYSHVQVKVRNATSNDPWGPTGTEMSEISQLTYNSSNEFYEIMDMLDKRLNDKGKNWRHVLKALKVLDYCLHEGSELVVTWARKNIYIIKTLREFIYVDEEGRDVGQNVRVSAKELTSLILDEERLRAERNDRKTWKSRVTGIEEYNSAHSPPEPSRRSRPHRAQRSDEEDAEYRLAIEASKYQEEEDRKRRQNQRQDPDDDDLAKAIKLSKEEEELRRRELEESNAASLFDDDPLPHTQPQYTGFNQGYQQQGAVDWSGNPIDQQNQMNMQPTGYNNNLYGQPTGFQSQHTGFQSQPTGYQNGFSNGINNQATGFDPYGQQASPFQPQQTGFNPYAQQQQQQQQPSAELQIPVSTNNPWATTNQQSAQPQVPMQTGSNNPFASSFNRPQTSSGVPQSQPTLSALQEQKTMSQFNNSSSFNPPTTFSPPPMPPIPQNVKPMSEHEAKLNALLASGDGMDTFGNTGDLRIPAQHTAPGQFLNSAGQGRRLDSQQTGNNPFLHNQFTGMPQTQYNNSGFNGQMMPAATGPASSFGGGGFGQQNNNNPFGQRTQQQQSSSSGGQDLIQF